MGISRMFFRVLIASSNVNWFLHGLKKYCHVHRITHSCSAALCYC